MKTKTGAERLSHTTAALQVHEARDQEGQMQKIKEPASGKRRRKKASLNAAAKERKRGKGRCRQE